MSKFFSTFNNTLTSAIAEAKSNLSPRIEFIPSGKGYTDDYLTTMIIQLLQIIALLPYNNKLLTYYAQMFDVDDTTFRAGLKIVLGKHGPYPIQPNVDGLNEIVAKLADHFNINVVEITLSEWTEHQLRMTAKETGL